MKLGIFKDVVKAKCIFMMVSNMRVNGEEIKGMVSVFITGPMALDTKANFKTACDMVKAKSVT